MWHADTGQVTDGRDVQCRASFVNEVKYQAGRFLYLEKAY